MYRLTPCSRLHAAVHHAAAHHARPHLAFMIAVALVLHLGVGRDGRKRESGDGPKNNFLHVCLQVF